MSCGALRMVRAIATLCFSPPLSFRPLSPTWVSYPAKGNENSCFTHLVKDGRSYSCSVVNRQVITQGKHLRKSTFFRLLWSHMTSLNKQLGRKSQSSYYVSLKSPCWLKQQGKCASYLQGKSWFCRGCQRLRRPPPPLGRWRRCGRSECCPGWCRWRGQYPEEPLRYGIAKMTASPEGEKKKHKEGAEVITRAVNTCKQRREEIPRA